MNKRRMAHLLDRPFKEKRKKLVLMHLFIGFTEVLLRFFIKSQLTSRRAEVIRLAFVFGCTGGGCGVNIHPADWIMDSCCHGLLLLFESIITVKDRFTNSHITR